MTRQHDLAAEEHSKKRHEALVRACEFELVGSLSSAGADLLGFSAKIDQYQCCITLRCFVDDMRQVTHVVSDTLTDGLIKCVTMAKTDRLKWKEDKWAPK